jgi:hypothetical protein
MQVAVQDIGQVTYLRRGSGTGELGGDHDPGWVGPVWWMGLTGEPESGRSLTNHRN